MVVMEMFIPGFAEPILVDEDVFEWASQLSWHPHGDEYRRVARTSYPNGRSCNPKIILMHREVLQAPEGILVDHINGVTIDNRRCNLRLCNSTQNNLNRKKHGQRRGQPPSSRYKGVIYYPDRESKGLRPYCVYGPSKSGSKNIGYFQEEVEAAVAYDNYAKKYSPFCSLNFK